MSTNMNMWDFRIPKERMKKIFLDVCHILVEQSVSDASGIDTSPCIDYARGTNNKEEAIFAIIVTHSVGHKIAEDPMLRAALQLSQQLGKDLAKEAFEQLIDHALAQCPKTDVEPTVLPEGETAPIPEIEPSECPNHVPKDETNNDKEEE